MKTINMSVILLLFALIMLSLAGCATNSRDNSNTVPWDHPDILDNGAMPLTTGGRADVVRTSDER